MATSGCATDILHGFLCPPPQYAVLKTQPEAPQMHLPKSEARRGLGRGSHPIQDGHGGASREITALAEQNYPTIGFSVPSARGGFVLAITAGLLSNGRYV